MKPASAASLKLAWKQARLLFLCGAIAGCRTAAPAKSRLAIREDQRPLSMLQVRLLVNDLAQLGARRIEVAADRVLVAASDDRAVCRSALQWKLHGVSAFLQAGARHDPVLALGSLQLLAIQMRRYLEAGAGRDVFGSHQEIAANAARALEQEARAVWGRQFLRAEDREAAWRALEALAEQAPLHDLSFARDSPAAAILDSLVESERDIIDIVGSIDDTFAGLQAFLSIQMLHLPRHARWQLELVLLDLDRVPAVARTLDVLPVVETFPEFLKQEEQLALAAITREREALAEALTQERKALVEALLQVRDESVVELERQRDFILGDLHRERQRVFEELDQHHRRFVSELDTLGQNWIGAAQGVAGRLLNRALALAALAVAVLSAAILGAAMLVRARR